MEEVLGSSITAICTAELNFTVSGCAIKRDYGFTADTVTAGSGLIAIDLVTINPVNLPHAGEHTCTVTVTTDGDFCTESVSGLVFPPRTSDAVILRVQCMS